MTRTDVADLARDILGIGPPRAAETARRQQIGIGVAAVVVVVVTALVLGLLYLRPPGYQRFSAEFTNTSGVRSGDQVRIAGIQVGKVESLRVDGDRVLVGFTVRNGERIGAETSIAVKLLTPVGGRFLQLTPTGDRPLGDAVIPSERVSGTYDLSSILEAATPKAEALDGTKFRALIERTHEGMKAQPWLGKDVLDTIADLADELVTRSGQLQRTLRVSDEYVAATATDRKVLFQLIVSLGEIGQELGSRHVQVRRVFNLLTRLLRFIERPVLAYADRIEGPVHDIADMLERLEPKAANIDKALSDVETALAGATSMLGTQGIRLDQGSRTVTGVKLCVPAPGREC